MKQHLWKDQSACLGIDTNIFFDKYEEDIDARPIVDSLCKSCPVAKTCFAVGVSGKEWGVWGGIDHLKGTARIPPSPVRPRSMIFAHEEGYHM